MFTIQQINRHSFQRMGWRSRVIPRPRYVHARARKNTNQEGVDRNVVGLGLSICTALVLLSACTVTTLSLREVDIEKQHLMEDYAKLEEKVMMLEDKDVQHEIVINALVNEVMKLRDIGIV